MKAVRLFRETFEHEDLANDISGEESNEWETSGSEDNENPPGDGEGDEDLVTLLDLVSFKEYTTTSIRMACMTQPLQLVIKMLTFTPIMINCLQKQDIWNPK